ncbi:hypothetical protein [Pokkaliibacter plantistimulans]|uniref:hypothetical protein n=1 Tax=Pokkaliibacter plantistimulans TaxID=1635171 RepID=UPI001403D0C5|nr:hypothetical protein [Pokkaliibacter plantistimulans]
MKKKMLMLSAVALLGLTLGGCYPWFPWGPHDGGGGGGGGGHWGGGGGPGSGYHGH